MIAYWLPTFFYAAANILGYLIAYSNTTLPKLSIIQGAVTVQRDAQSKSIIDDIEDMELQHEHQASEMD